MTSGSNRPARRIGHVDMDSFFASVEIRDDPSLKGRPVVVGGPSDKRGVVAAASYEARRFGIHSAMPMAEAARLCPDLVRVAPNGAKYKEASGRVMEILHDFSPRVEPLSLDEAFLDLTGAERLLGPPEKIGADIRKRIFEATRLTASVGIAPNKFVAKLASDQNKPDGLCVVGDGEAAAFVQALPIERMWGVGKKTKITMERMGVRTIGDLAALGPARVKHELGIGALGMFELAWARDDREVVPDQDPQSVSHEITFARNQSSDAVLQGVLLGLAEQVGARLRRHGFQGRTVFLKLRFSDFRTITRRVTPGRYTDDSRAIYEAALTLLAEARTVSELPVRLIGVGVTSLSDPEQIPLNLFGRAPAEERAARLNAVLDRIEGRFGRNTVRRAGAMVAGRVEGTDSALERVERPGRSLHGPADAVRPGVPSPTRSTNKA